MSTEHNVVVTRVLDAPVEPVWRAWSESEQVMRWWGPTGFTCPVARMDVREGGTSLVCMRSPDGHDIYNTWTYERVVPMWSSSSSSGSPTATATRSLRRLWAYLPTSRPRCGMPWRSGRRARPDGADRYRVRLPVGADRRALQGRHGTVPRQAGGSGLAAGFALVVGEGMMALRTVG